MRKKEFIDQLEYLLQDIPDQEREEAIDYYRDYLEEAGPENEEKALEEFGSPERVAAIIRAEIAGNLEDGGSFTENGYEDERFRDPNYQVIRRMDLPDQPEEKEKEADGAGYAGGAGGQASDSAGYRADSGNAGYGYAAGSDGNTGAGYGSAGAGYGGGSGTYSGGAYNGPYREKYTKSRTVTPDEGKPWTNGLLKGCLWCILAVVALPFLLGGGGIVLGCIVGVITLIFGIIITLLACEVAAIVGGAVLLGAGIALTASTVWVDAFWVIGLALITFGCAVLGAVLLAAFFGALLPLIWRGLVGAVNRLRNGRRERKHE